MATQSDRKTKIAALSTNPYLLVLNPYLLVYVLCKLKCQAVQTKFMPTKSHLIS